MNFETLTTMKFISILERHDPGFRFLAESIRRYCWIVVP
jgi:hypothetical protein